MLLTSCVSFQQPNYAKGPLYKYKADMIMTIDGKTFDGMAVTKLDGEKTITVYSKARADVLIVHTCHRYEKFENLKTTDFRYTYKPTAKELEGRCPIYIEAYDKSGLTDWGYIAFRNDEELPASVECNGTNWKFAGFTVCQTQAGLEEAIHFSSPIRKFEASENCNLKQRSDKDFDIKPALGFCNATFTDGTNWHAATFLGFEQAFVRGQ